MYRPVDSDEDVRPVLTVHGHPKDLDQTQSVSTRQGAQQDSRREAWCGRAIGLAVSAALVVLTGTLLLQRDASARLPIKFMVIGDFGRRGQFNQSEVARLLAIKAADMDPDFILSVGDNMYPSGLSSIDDAAFDASFVRPYAAKSLQVPWYVILGNHDYGDKCYDEPPGCYVYGGDTFYSPLHQLDAEVVNRDWRWNCQRTFERRLGGGVAELFFIDTSPAVQKYYNQPWANFTGGATSFLAMNYTHPTCPGTQDRILRCICFNTKTSRAGQAASGVAAC